MKGERKLNLSTREKFLVFFGLLVVLVTLYLVGVRDPLDRQLDELENNLQAVRMELTRGLRLDQERPRIEQELAEVKARLAELKRVVPEEEETASFLRILQASAGNAGVLVERVSVGTPEPAGPFVKRSVEVRVAGTLEQQGYYLELLEAGPRLFRVQSMELGPADAEGRDPEKANRFLNHLTLVIFSEKGPQAEISGKLVGTPDGK